MDAVRLRRRAFNHLLAATHDFGANLATVLLAVLVVLPAWLIGFATPVFAWWSITSRHMGINISRRDAEWILAAGMLSTIPAIIINSVITPVMIHPFGLNAAASGTLGEGIVLFLSAPIGEELSKGLAVLFLSHLIISPKHGFYVGSTVGLGFALLENAQYISMALASDYSSITYFFTATLRGLSSIPGHAMWTGLTGYAMGCWLAQGHRLPNFSKTAYLSEDAEANWVLYDKNGLPVTTSGWTTMPSDRMMRLLVKHQRHAWSMPTTVQGGLFLAMLGHGLWNGSSWGVGMLLKDGDPVLSVLLQLAWLVVMVAALWFCILRWLPTIVLALRTWHDVLNRVRSSKRIRLSQILGKEPFVARWSLMDVFTSGPNVGNLLVTCGLVIFLLIASTKAKCLIKAVHEPLHCSVWWLVALGIGHGCSFCSASCSVHTRRQNGVLKKRRNLGSLNPATATVVGPTSWPTVLFQD